MRFTLDIRDEFLIWLDNACALAARKRHDAIGFPDIETQDIINAQVLGAAKAAGFGKRKRK